MAIDDSSDVLSTILTTPDLTDQDLDRNLTTDVENALSTVTPRSWKIILIAVGCGLLIIGTVVGNILVVTAVGIVRKLRTPSNLLIVSLAVSDLLVAGLVMPFAALYEAAEHWPLGTLLCDMWTSLDVMLCTASILNLCAISIDRYLVITRPLQYALRRNRIHMAMMIVVVWSLSAVISIPPLFGWRWNDPDVKGRCELSQEIGYQIYATFGAFYLPLVVMMFIYFRIYRVSSRIAQTEANSRPSSVRQREGSTAPTVYRSLPHSSGHRGGLGEDDDEQRGHEGTDSPRNSSSTRTSSYAENGGRAMIHPSNGDESALNMLPPKKPRTRSTIRRLTRSRSSFKTALRERKATRTLGVIMGAFTACWLPFFIVALVRPFHLNIPKWLGSLLLWLGYTNSFLNPIIYARFNRDFRKPFKDILLLRCHGINTRQRSESYAEQYGTGSVRDNCRPVASTAV